MITQRPSCKINRDSSAILMNSTGGIRPFLGVSCPSLYCYSIVGKQSMLNDIRKPDVDDVMTLAVLTR